MAMGRTATRCIVAGLLVAAAQAEAQVRYVDGQGIVHWVRTPEQIPPEYREKAEQPKLPEIDAGKGEDPVARARRKAFEADVQERARVQEQAERPTQRQVPGDDPRAKLRERLTPRFYDEHVRPYVWTLRGSDGRRWETGTSSGSESAWQDCSYHKRIAFQGNLGSQWRGRLGAECEVRPADE